MAGLLAACALSETFDRVVLLERDHLPDGARHRRGVPQGEHLHGLLAGGLAAMTNLLPGFEDDLLAAGAVRSDVQSDIHWWVDAHLIKPEPSGIVGFSCSRRLLEHTVRNRVKALPKVQIIEDCDVLGILSADDGESISGVRIRSGVSSTEASTLPADLVIDATGRASRSSQWLTGLGYQDAEETRIPVDITYVTRTYRRERGQLDGRAGTFTGPYPGLPIGAFLLALEDDTFMLTTGGIYGETPPMDDDGLVDLAGKLPTRDFTDFLRTATRTGDPLKTHYRVSVRRHYERLTEFPAGYLVVGDALCSFNPIFAQGMSVAAAEAVLLRDLLHAGCVNVAAEFFEGAAKIIDVPWLIAVNADLRYPQCKLTQTAEAKAFDEYLRRVYRAASMDRTLATAIMRVINLLETPVRLLEPGVVVRVMQIIRGDAADANDPVQSEFATEFAILPRAKTVC